MASLQESLVETLRTKSVWKQNTSLNTKKHFEILKSILQELATELSTQLAQVAPSLKVSYEELSPFDVQLMFSGDVLIFSMHTNTFEFDPEHVIHKNIYTAQQKLRSMCGMIQVYNFLSDSVRYQRMNDVGYLIARIFINAEDHFFVDGNKQLMFHFSDFSTLMMTKESMKNLIGRCLQYALDFDLYVPPFDTVREISLAQKWQTTTEHSVATGKRLGFDLSQFDMKDRSADLEA